MMRVKRLFMITVIVIPLLSGMASAQTRTVTPLFAAVDKNMDVPSAWAIADVDDMRREGLVPAELQSGYRSNITRAEFTKLAGLVLERLVGKEANENLHKVITEQRFMDSYEEQVYMAYNFGIVNGVSDDVFEPDRPISRKEAVVMMANILATLKAEGIAMDRAPYTDYAAIPSWARVSADITYNAKIFAGSTAGMEPDKPYTREQSIVTMRRLLNFVKEVQGISYRGKVYIEFNKIDDVRVGRNYVKIGSPKGESQLMTMWDSIAHNFPNVDITDATPRTITSGEFKIQTSGEDYLIKISW